MATTFDLFFLGIGPEIDTIEGNVRSENHVALEGMIFGGTSDPLAAHVQTLSPDGNSYAGGANTTAYDSNNAASNETFIIDGITRTHDTSMLYSDTVITYTDDSSARIDAIIMQATDGSLYLMPPATGPSAYSDALEAKPIASIILGTAKPANGTNTYALLADRYELTLRDHIVEDTSGDDLIDTNYTGDPDGDQIDGTDNVDDNNNDSVQAGDGNDTLEGGEGHDWLEGGEGRDTLLGGAGDDTIIVSQGDLADGGKGDDTFFIADLGEADTGSITIIGGEGGERRGDTLVLTPDISRADITFTNTDDISGGLSGTFRLTNGTVVNFSEIENIICFTPGARILTARGERPIETLRPGDLVITRDHGPQPVRWIGRRVVPGTGAFAPVRIAPPMTTEGGGGLLVSPQHRLLFTGYQTELMFGESEILVAAKHLVNGQDVCLVPCATVTYIHIMFDRHEVIYAEGIATESFYASNTALAAVDNPAREELFAIFPELRSAPGRHRETARPCLKAREAALLHDFLRDRAA
ncbi:MAG: Hint domain-containing protein [Roseovarius sp.]|nr:Hint domain-containing protein [Roseovarius sp.]